MSYNEVFKRYGKMNPWILITLHEKKAVEALFQYANFFLHEFEASQSQQLSAISLLFKNLLFFP